MRCRFRPSPLVSVMAMFALTFTVGILIVFGSDLLPNQGLGSVVKRATKIRIAIPGVYSNSEPLDVEYECSLVNGDSVDAIFEVTNATRDTIYFTDEEPDGRSKVTVFDYTARRAVRVDGDFSTRELLPGSHATLQVSLPAEISSFKLLALYYANDRTLPFVGRRSFFPYIAEINVPVQHRSNACLDSEFVHQMEAGRR